MCRDCQAARYPGGDLCHVSESVSVTVPRAKCVASVGEDIVCVCLLCSYQSKGTFGKVTLPWVKELLGRDILYGTELCIYSSHPELDCGTVILKGLC